MSRKKCTDCQDRPRASRAESGSMDNTMCLPCLEYAYEENRHSDDGHESTPADDCPVCVPELDPRNEPVKTGHSKGVAKSRMSHRNCNHDATKKERARCRREREKNRVRENTDTIVNHAFVFVRKAREEGHSNRLSQLLLCETAEAHKYKSEEWNLDHAVDLVRARAELLDQTHLLAEDF